MVEDSSPAEYPRDAEAAGRVPAQVGRWVCPAAAGWRRKVKKTLGGGVSAAGWSPRGQEDNSDSSFALAGDGFFQRQHRAGTRGSLVSTMPFFLFPVA